MTDAERKKQHYDANKDRYASLRSARYQDDKQTYADRVRKWQQNNKEKRCFYVRKRKERIAAIDELFPGEWGAVVAGCGNRCIVPECGASPVTMDHVKPLSEGGRHHVSNLQPLCAACNTKKGTKMTDYRLIP